MINRCIVSALLVSIIFTSAAVAQVQNKTVIDSLLKKIITLKEDTNKIKLLNELSYRYAYVEPREGLRYGQEGLNLAQKLQWDPGMAGAYSSIGGNYENQSDVANALKYEYDALKIYEKLGDKKKEATLLLNIGIVYHNYGNQAKALEYDSLALAKFTAMNDMEGKALVYANLGNIYSNQGNHSGALKQYELALKINRDLGLLQRASTNIGNIANVYADDGKSAIALVYYFQALRIDEQSGDRDGIARNMGNIGETYLDIAKDTTGKMAPDSLVPAGKAANLAKAITFLEASVKNAKEINRPGYVEAYSQSLSESYLLSGNCMDAFRVYKEYIIVRDSVLNLQKDKEFTRHQLDYEYGKREDQLRYEKKLAEQRYTIGITCFALLSVFIYRNFRTQKRSNAIITREKKRSEDLLLNILPAEVAEELKEKGSAEAKLFDHVTVLFTDFVSFTTVSERLTPQELIDELHTCFKAFDEIIDKHGIEKIKTIGDAYLAVGGLPVADHSHAEHIVRAAIEIVSFMQQRQQQKGNRTFEVRIGIHSGSVVAGIVGVKKFAYDIWGDTVNTAARMEQNSMAGKINISEATYELVKHKFKCTYRGEIEAKNKGSLKMYFIDVLG